MKKTQITILGATGSIGQSTLDVVARHNDRYAVYAMTAATNADLMVQLALQHRPQVVVMADEHAASQVQSQLQQLSPGDYQPTIESGVEALCRVAGASEVDAVMAAIVGAAGLLPSLAAAEAGKKVLLANKESLVMAGPLFMQAVADGGATLLPIDSEHNAIYQSLPADYCHDFAQSGIRHLLLTASGGPFRGWSHAELDSVTPAQAVKHPNWSMGQKISVDSATLMNKGLELIEACFLFSCQPSQVEVVVQPQSVIHSMVQYIDGSVIAQLGQPDMRTPIAYGLAWPERIEAGVDSLNLFDIARLDFAAADEDTFACLRLARQAFEQGGTQPAVLNAANEVAVDAFLREQLSFNHIPVLIDEVMRDHEVCQLTTLEDVLKADDWARKRARQFLQEQ